MRDEMPGPRSSYTRRSRGRIRVSREFHVGVQTAHAWVVVRKGQTPRSWKETSDCPSVEPGDTIVLPGGLKRCDPAPAPNPVRSERILQARRAPVFIKHVSVPLPGAGLPKYRPESTYATLGRTSHYSCSLLRHAWKQASASPQREKPGTRLCPRVSATINAAINPSRHIMFWQTKGPPITTPSNQQLGSYVPVF